VYPIIKIPLWKYYNVFEKNFFHNHLRFHAKCGSGNETYYYNRYHLAWWIIQYPWSLCWTNLNIIGNGYSVYSLRANKFRNLDRKAFGELSDATRINTSPDIHRSLNGKLTRNRYGGIYEVLRLICVNLHSLCIKQTTRLEYWSLGSRFKEQQQLYRMNMMLMWIECWFNYYLIICRIININNQHSTSIQHQGRNFP